MESDKICPHMYKKKKKNRKSALEDENENVIEVTILQPFPQLERLELCWYCLEK